MLFERRLREGIADGTITVAFRRWKRPQVTAAHRYRTGVDIVEMRSVDIVDPASVTREDARLAGYGSVQALLADLRGGPDLPLYRLVFRRVDEPDPRAALAADDHLAPADVNGISRHLERLDRSAAGPPWTLATLRAIDAHPAMRAGDLAAILGYERGWLKLRVRSLKNLGLTISLATGYRLSPRGAAYLSRRDTAHATGGEARSGGRRPADPDEAGQFGEGADAGSIG
jgi:hypothetical protein